jgi:hypothetical protein
LSKDPLGVGAGSASGLYGGPTVSALSDTVPRAVQKTVREQQAEPDQENVDTPRERERWEPADEPTRIERLICAQFRRGLPVQLTPRELQDMAKMSVWDRCDYVAKIAVRTARACEYELLRTEPPKVPFK